MVTYTLNSVHNLKIYANQDEFKILGLPPDIFYTINVVYEEIWK